MESAYFEPVTFTPEFMTSAWPRYFRWGPGRRFLLDVHYRTHPGVDTALELVDPRGKRVDLDGLTGSHERHR